MHISFDNSSHQDKRQITRAGLLSQDQLSGKGVYENRDALREKQLKACISHRTTPTSELNLSRQTPQELAFLFSCEVSPKAGPIRVLWTRSICDRGEAWSLSRDLFMIVKDRVKVVSWGANHMLSASWWAALKKTRNLLQLRLVYLAPRRAWTQQQTHIIHSEDNMTI